MCTMRFVWLLALVVAGPSQPVFAGAAPAQPTDLTPTTRPLNTVEKLQIPQIDLAAVVAEDEERDRQPLTDVHPNLNGTQINLSVNFDDVFQIIQGFKGEEYPGSDLTQCP